MTPHAQPPLASPPRPPATAVWLLSRRIPAALRDFILGDLEEEFRDRHAVSPADARRWYWRQTIRCLAAPPPAPPSATQIPDDMFSRHTGDSLMRTVLADVRLALRVFVRTPGSRSPRLACSRSELARTPPSSAWSTPCCCARFRSPSPTASCASFTCRRRPRFPNTPRFPLSPANFYDWQAAAKKFDGMAMFRFREFVLTGQGEAATVTAGALGAGFLRIIRVQPALGRDFLPEEDEPGRGRVVILSDRFWRTTSAPAPT